MFAPSRRADASRTRGLGAWFSACLVALLATSAQLVVLPVTQVRAAPSSSVSGVPENPQSCGALFTSGYSFMLGKAVRDVNVLIGVLRTGTLYLPLKRGDEIIIAGENPAAVCVMGFADGTSATGWVPQGSVSRLGKPVVATPKAWSGVWTDVGGDWIAIRATGREAVIVNGRACWAQCDHLGSLRDLVSSRSAGSTASGLAATLFFAPQGNGCRFFATLLSHEEMIVSDEHGSCGGLNVTWTSVYYKVSPYPVVPYPPYAKMKAYFKKKGVAFMTLPEQEQARCNNCPYGARPLKMPRKSPFIFKPRNSPPGSSHDTQIQ